MKKDKVSRGDIYYFDFGEQKGSVQSGKRPVLVVQADEFNTHAPTIIVASITSIIKKRFLPSHVLLGEAFGLKKPSMVLLEQIQTVNKNELNDYVGTIDDERLLRTIDNTLKKTFGFWKSKPVDDKTVRCLCSHCLNDYISSGAYIIKRVDRFAKRKSRCDKCGKPGWDYSVTERKEKTK